MCNRLREESVVSVLENYTDSSKLGEKIDSFCVGEREFDWWQIFFPMPEGFIHNAAFSWRDRETTYII